MLRYLRTFAVTASAAAGLVALLLWIRTGFSCDTVFGPMSQNGGFVVTSRQGGLSVGIVQQGMPNFGTHALPPETVPQLKYHGGMGFGVCNTPERFVLRSPYWFYVFVSGIMLAALTLKAPPRFSLQTMLVAITLVAVALGIIMAAG